MKSESERARDVIWEKLWITLQNTVNKKKVGWEGIRMMRGDSGESEMKEQTERKVDEVISQGES